MVKSLPAMRETWVWSLGWEDLLEEGMATHSSFLALENPRGQRSLAGHCPWGHKESDTTKQVSTRLVKRESVEEISISGSLRQDLLSEMWVSPIINILNQSALQIQNMWNLFPPWHSLSPDQSSLLLIISATISKKQLFWFGNIYQDIIILPPPPMILNSYPCIHIHTNTPSNKGQTKLRFLHVSPQPVLNGFSIFPPPGVSQAIRNDVLSSL